MGEGEIAKGYRPRDRLMRTATGVAVAGVAAIMVLSAAAMAVTVKAPYKMSVGSPSADWSVYGCGSSKILKTPSWTGKTGTGSGGASTSTGKSCAFPGYGEGYSSTGEEVEIGFHTGAGATNVTPTVKMTYTGTGAITSKGSCPSMPLNQHTFYNYSVYGFEYWYNITASGYGFCYSTAETEAYYYLWLEDFTNGTDIPITYGTGCTYVFGDECYGYAFNYSENYTSIEWNYVDNFTEFYTGGSYYYNYSCASCNYSFSTPSTSYSTVTSLALDPSFLYSFWPTHTYLLDFEVGTFVYGYSEGWTVGSGTASMNFATSGNGFSVPGISVT